MTDDTIPQATPPEPAFPDVAVRRRRFASIWLVPIIAAVVAGYLAIRSYHEHGPLISISFRTGDGLTAGQTPVKYKSVTIGLVEDVALTPDMSHVVAHVRMATKADSLLTDRAKFWVVKPRFNAANISDLEPLVSGTYIGVLPGDAGGKAQTAFTGLENPPDAQVPSEPGAVYMLQTDKLGSLGPGSPVFYRDINVGNVLNYELGDGYGPMTLNIFVRAPYDRFVKSGSRFWNASGVTVGVGPEGVKVELQSLQTLLAGGIAFDTPLTERDGAPAAPKSDFTLYDTRKEADAALFNQRISCVAYFQTSIKDLAPGSPVQIFGIPAGSVTDVKLVYDKAKGDARVRVAFDVQPQRAFAGDTTSAEDPAEMLRRLVQNGMRVKLGSSSLIAGQETLSLEFAPRSEPGDIALEGTTMVLPGVTGGFDNLADALGDVAGKLNAIPFDSIGKNLDHLISSADKAFNGPEVKQAMHDLALTMASAQDLSRKANDNLTPALQRLPAISAQLQDAVTHANTFMSSLDNGYGADSDFGRSARRVMDQINDAARSIRLLADFLDRHPEALLTGKPQDNEGKQ